MWQAEQLALRTGRARLHRAVRRVGAVRLLRQRRSKRCVVAATLRIDVRNEERLRQRCTQFVHRSLQPKLATAAPAAPPSQQQRSRGIRYPPPPAAQAAAAPRRSDRTASRHPSPLEPSPAHPAHPFRWHEGCAAPNHACTGPGRRDGSKAAPTVCSQLQPCSRKAAAKGQRGGPTDRRTCA